MRVAWVCEYPAFQFADRRALAGAPLSHPLPWLTVQAPLVAAMPGVELHVVTVGKRFAGDDDFVDGGVHFHFRRVPRFPRAMLLYQIDRMRIHQCLDEIRPDVVQGFGTEAGYGYSAATSGCQTVVLRVQGIQSAINSAVPMRVLLAHPRFLAPVLLERWTVRRCRDFICPTMFAARFVKRLNPAAAIHLMKTPVRPEAFTVHREPAPAGAPELLFAGSVIPAKGIEVLLRAVSIVARRHPELKLHVAGSGEPRYIAGTLGPLIDRLGITDRVVFHGYLPTNDLVSLWARATMLVLPTFMDTAPNVVAEAQVAGLPVVASAVGGVPEMIEHDVSGLLVEAGADRPLADAILRLLDDPDTARRFARAAQDRARLDHRPEEQVRKLVGLYHQLAALSVPRRRAGAAVQNAS
jgi:glycosyltransferase involved in cell wall biosynthesis